MGKIKRLSDNMVDKIAAGEVIERPASVVKELVENAIDAGADQIRVELRGGGKESIIVSDNGVGMGREDLEVCIERHATSKIEGPQDLFAIKTLGFRGEALPSIAGVSRLSVESQAEGSDMGYRLVVEGGVRRGPLQPMARSQGTLMAVRSLFFNTPARRKFLKKNETEVRHCTQIVVNLAAANAAVQFEVLHQGRRVVYFPGGDQRSRAAQLLQVEPDELGLAEFQDGALKVSGFVVPPHKCRPGRGRQFFLVRGRPVRSRPVQEAIVAAYGALLAANRVPAYLLDIDVPANMVDVNVHPAKREVRFAEEAQIVEAVRQSVGQALHVPRSVAAAYGDDTVVFQPVKIRDAPPAIDLLQSLKPETQKIHEVTSTPSEQPQPPEPPQAALALEFESRAEDKDENSLWAAWAAGAAVWPLEKGFALCKREGEFLLLSCPLAHEWIAYSNALGHMAGDGAQIQQLLAPLTVELNPVEMAFWEEHGTYFKAVGFDMRAVGPRAVLVEGIPSGMPEEWDDGHLLRQLFNEEVGGTQMHHSFALRLAKIAAEQNRKRVWHSQEVKSLLEQLRQTPHGDDGWDGRRFYWFLKADEFVETIINTHK